MNTHKMKTACDLKFCEWISSSRMAHFKEIVRVMENIYDLEHLLRLEAYKENLNRCLYLIQKIMQKEYYYFDNSFGFYRPKLYNIVYYLLYIKCPKKLFIQIKLRHWFRYYILYTATFYALCCFHDELRNIIMRYYEINQYSYRFNMNLY